MAQTFSTKLMIPIFDPAARYVFFDDLMKETNRPGVDVQKQALYRHAHGYYNHLFHDIAVESENPSEIISSAISFLGNVAESERRKEIHAIEYYLKDLYNQIPDTLKRGRTFQTIINDLKTLSRDLATGKVSQTNINEFYVELTSYINMIRTELIDFQARVHQLANDQKDDRGMRAELASIRLKSDYATLFKSISGTQQKNTAKSFSSRVRNIATDYLIKRMKNNLNIDLGSHFPAILAGLVGDFEYYIEHDRNLTGDFSRALDKISKTQLTSLFEQYIDKCDTLYLQRFENYTRGINVDEFIDALDRFESILGLKLLGRNSTDARKQLELIKQQEALMKKKNLNGRNYVSRALKNNGFQDIAESNELLSWTFETRTGHGRVYEALKDLLLGHHNIGSRGGATDSLALGRIKGEVNTELIEQALNSHFDQVADEISNMVLKEREDRFQDYSKNVQKANDNIREIEKELGKTISALSSINIEDVFIYHESLKLYSSVEVTEGNNRRTTKFHGRDMQVLSALDNLFSLADLSLITLPDKDSMYGIVLNLAEGAVAHQSLPLVENYLSIFAGLLMFSDIHDMAADLANQAVTGIQHQDPTKIHLYLLNDTYVPGSMILTYIFQTLQEGYAKINVKDGARVDIKTKAAAGTIETYLAARSAKVPYDPEDWEIIADTIASNTTMRIEFLSSYISFIKKIAKVI